MSCRWVADVKSDWATWLDGAMIENVPSDCWPKIVVAPVDVAGRFLAFHRKRPYSI